MMPQLGQLRMRPGKLSDHLSSTELGEFKDVRVICQIRSLETLGRETDIVTWMLDSWELQS